ncbi:hypothetical protein AB1207_07245 [Kineococcus endophyticus]|uniref:Uncharacterized protein n=1 Tax=Kineococcus endophyticus TaxID=1181883 RepID=A0ABV3P4I1_9ACTN
MWRRQRRRPLARGLALDSELFTTLNPYQQLKREIHNVLHEPVAWVSQARVTQSPLSALVRRPLPWRPVRVVLALTSTHVVVFSTGDVSSPFEEPSFERFTLTDARAVGRRQIRVMDVRGRVRWFRLEPHEPPARGFLTQPRSYRAR